MSSLYRRLAAAGLALSAFAASANDFSIVNGEEAKRDAYPWIASIGSKFGNAYQAHSCGGSLIHPSWVLTASHCFDSDEDAPRLMVTFGRHKLSETGGVRVAVKRVIRHPKFDDNYNNDIALVELAEPVNNVPVAKVGPLAEFPKDGALTRAIGHGGLAAPIDFLIDAYMPSANCYLSLEKCLAEIQESGVKPLEIVNTMLKANGSTDLRRGIGYKELVTQLKDNGGTVAADMSVEKVVEGLLGLGLKLSDLVQTVDRAAGVTDELRQIDLPLVGEAACNTAGYSITENMLCAGYADQPKDTCQGDSGGPLFAQRGRDWYQVGIVSFGATCATTYGVYTKAANYLDWIGEYVPRFYEDRLYAWAETVLRDVLKPSGDERSQAFGPYYARYYPASNTAIGSDGKNAYFYDGRNLLPLGPLYGFMMQAASAKY